MKKIAYSFVIMLAVGGLVYGLGLGVFKEGAAKGQQPPRKGGGERTVSVKVAKVRVGNVEEKLSFVASLSPNASVTVAPKMEGRVERLFVDVGDRVKEGQLLARMEKDELTEDLREAQASMGVYAATLTGKEAEHRNFKKRLERSRILLEKNLISREQVETLETQVLSSAAQVKLTRAQVAQTKARVENVRIRLKHADILSPFAGYVGSRFVDRGALVRPSSPLLTVIDIDRVKVQVAVVERDYRKISPGQLASVTLDAYPERRFQGKVSRRAPVLDKETRTGQVEIQLDNPDGDLKPGMFARVEVVVGRREAVLMVPEGAQVKASAGYGVFKIGDDKPEVRFVLVKPGISEQGWVEVEGSLQRGDRVVTLGSNLLRDGQKVRVIIEGKTPGSGKKRKRRRS